MHKIILDGQYLLEKEMAHVYLQEKLDLPEYYGKNLDALYDCLTEFVNTEIHICTSFDEELQKEKTGYFYKIIRVFQVAEKENRDLKVTFS